MSNLKERALQRAIRDTDDKNYSNKIIEECNSYKSIDDFDKIKYEKCNDDAKKVVLGAIGEFVTIICEETPNIRLVKSPKKYDTKKDLVKLEDDKIITREVKTQSAMKLCPINNTRLHAFTFRRNQLEKIKNVDELTIVSFLSKTHPLEYTVGRWLLRKGFSHYDYKTKKTKNRNPIEMIGVPIQENIESGHLIRIGDIPKEWQDIAARFQTEDI